MNEPRDPLLESLFAGAKTVVAEDGFTDQVMSRVENRRRNVLVGRVAIVAMLLAMEVLLEAPVNNSLGAFTGWLGTELLDLGASWGATLLAPLNSIAGLLGLGLVGLHALFRRLGR